MIKCSFCSNTKASKYLFTQCLHFVCMNCASLRVNQGVKCCNKMTQISNEVKQELMKKKLEILRNLEKSYEEDENQTHKQQDYYQQRIAQNNNLSQKEQNVCQTNKNYLREIIDINEKQEQKYVNLKLSTPIDKFYSPQKSYQKSLKNNKQIFQINEYAIQDKKIYESRKSPTSKEKSISKQKLNKSLEKDKKDHDFICRQKDKISSPIKFLQDQQNNNIDDTMHFNEKVTTQNKVDKNNQSRSINQRQLQQILQRKTQQVKEQFRLLKNQLNKRQEEVLAHLQKEYVKNIVDMNMNLSEDRIISNELLQKQKLTLNLQAILKLYSVKIKNLRENMTIFCQKQKSPQTIVTSSYMKSDYKNLQNEHLFQSNNYNKNHQLQQFKPDYKDLGIYQHSNLQQNSFKIPKKCRIQNPLSVRSPNLMMQATKQSSLSKPNKELQKIYRKLDQSRTKLQERIQKHNMFLSQRYKSEFI